MSAAAAAQVAASVPGRSSWVSANAGSGKTRVLTERVARLLLAGTDPQKILCLTYTTAAAAEMQHRLFRTLGDWSMRDDAPLRAALDRLRTAADAPPPDLGRARTLFARALETPGGLRIQTIHAFCDALLRRFPLEAGVAPHFRVLDDRQARVLREEVLDGLARSAPTAVSDLARHLTGIEADPLLREIGHHRAAFAGPLDPAALAAAMGTDPATDPVRLAEAAFDPDDATAIAALLPALHAARVRDAGLADGLAAALAAPDAMGRLAALEAALLTEDGAVRASPPTKAVRADHPDLCARLDALSTRVADARARRVAFAAYEKSLALGRFARGWLAAFDARKAALGLLDFDDMILRASALLADAAAAAWVLWRLDGGIDHILVDEAQDTSPAQWEVMRAISAEFFAGAGARDVDRTVFVVGDEKQSIYSFQGADPAAFGAMRDHFDRLMRGVGDELARCELIHSFRSAAPILRLVDAVFSGPAGRGIDAPVAHVPFRPEMPGRVELWPFLPRPDAAGDDVPWDRPVETPPGEDPVAVLARRVAATVRGWLDTGRVLPGEARRIRAGDVMILVQRRGPIFDAVIAELKRARVPVAGADVLRIGGELAVKDLLAVLRVAATPADDLSLAAVLRSPLGGLTEDELFALAHGRRGTLRSALAAAPPGRWGAVRALLADILAQSDYLRPFELLHRILVRHGGRKRLIARLGPEAEDGIDALLDQAVAYDSVEPPSLTGFLDWIGRDDVTVKRRVEDGSDQVRVMTVHGAKGLEAPIVILPDTAWRNDAANAPEILHGPRGLPLWRVRKKDAPPAIAAAEAARRERVRAENMRLLYVALTRAARWLIVAGAGEAPKTATDMWHRLVDAAMDDLGAREVTDPLGPARVIAHAWTDAPAGAAAAPTAGAPDLPAWARRPAPRPAVPAPPVPPSGLGGAHVVPGRPEDDSADARSRGEAIHRLLEVLPEVPRSDRAAVAAGLLTAWPELGPDVLAEAGAVLDAPELGFVFDPSTTLAEVDVSAEIGALGRRMVGRVDRLVLSPGRVLVVDYKSNRGVPAGAAAIPEAILRQMGAYRAALAAVWPGRTVATAVLWTAVPTLMAVPDALADAALARAALLDPADPAA